MKINLNDHVFVKMTDKGRAMHKAHWEPFSGGKYSAPMESHDGWAQFQLHEVMRIFGAEMGIGCDVPLGTDIMIDCNRPHIPPRPAS